MPILNYTTEVSVDKTVNEIYRILTNAGAKQVTFENSGDKLVTAITFVVDLDGEPLAFRLEPSPDGVLASMRRDNAPRRYQNTKQALRVAWRILKNAVDAQMAIYQSKQADLAEIFVAHAVDPRNNERFYKLFRDSRLKQLTAGQGGKS
jgi:hypothetical protein